MSGRRPTLAGWRGNLLLAGGSVLVALGIAEVAARVVIARRPVIASGEQAVYSRTDPVLGWRNRPGTSVRYRRRDYQTSVGSDVVLVFVYYNDVLNNTRINYWGSPKPVTKIVAGEIVPTNLPLPEPSVTEESFGVRERPRPPLTGSAAWMLLAERIVTGAPGLHRRLARFGVLESIETEPVPDELRAYKVRGAVAEFNEAWDSTRALFAAMGEQIIARHAKPVLVYIPARFEINDRDWELTVKRYGIEPSVWDRSRVRVRFREVTEPYGWDFLDLTEPLRASTSVWNPTYLPYDGHWNPRGHDVAARAVVARLRERGLLPCAPSPR